MRLAWGVVGAGGIASRRTIPEGIVPARNAWLAGVVCAAAESTRRTADRFDARPYASSEELYRDPAIDVVYVATPNDLHCREVVAAARAGKHVLCEKPLALSLEECDRMLAAAEAHRVRLGVGFMMRFHPLHATLRAMVASGALGTPVFGRAQLTCWYPSIAGAWRQDQAQGGGPLADMGSHCIDLLEMLLGRAEAVTAFTASRAHDYPVEDTAVVALRFADGAVGVVDSHWSVPDAASPNALELYGTRGSVLASGTIGQESAGTMLARLEREPGAYDAAQARAAAEPAPVTAAIENLYRAQVESFSRAVLEGTEPLSSGADGRWNLRVVLAAYESARTGRTVRISENSPTA